MNPPASDAPAVRTGDRRAAGRRPRCRAAARRGCELVGRLRPHPRAHRARRSTASTTSTRACACPAASTCATRRASASWPTASGKAEFFAHPLVDATASPHRARRHGTTTAAVLFTLTTCARTTSTTPPSTAWTTATAACTASAACASSTRTTCADWACSDGDWVDITSVWRRRRAHGRSGFLLVDYDIPRGCLASYFPETNPLVPLDSHAERARTPTSKSIPVRLSRHTAIQKPYEPSPSPA